MTGVDLAILGAYGAAILWLGFGARRREGLEDYLLAGRSLSLPAFVATLVPSFFGGVMGVGEFSYRYGVSNWVTQGAPYYFFALLYAWLLAGKVRGFTGRTVPDHLESVFGKRTAVLAALWVALLASPATEMLMLGVLARWATGWPLAPCVLAAALLGTSFLLFGGLPADVRVNRLEFVMMFGGFFLIVPFAWRAAGGAAGLAKALPAAHLDWTGGQSPAALLTWFFIAFWTFVDPSFHQRVCAAKDAATARRGILVSIVFWFLFDCMTTTAGLCARALMPDLGEPLMAYPELAARLLPPVVRGLFIAGLCSSIAAAMGSVSLVSAASLGKDVAGRLLGAPAGEEQAWIRWGLAATAAGSALLAVALPSVVGLWYAIGSAAVPGLLVVMLSCYFERLRVGPRAAFASSLLGGGVSLAWLIAGAGGRGYPWGVEPFYPGLAASLAAWGVGRASR
jgi:solute:Na+ symporter, SSS family